MSSIRLGRPHGPPADQLGRLHPATLRSRFGARSGASGSSVMRAGGGGGAARADWPRDTPGRPVDLIRPDPSPTIAGTYLSSIFRPKSALRLAPVRSDRTGAPSAAAPPSVRAGAAASAPPTAYIADSYRSARSHFLHYIKPISRGLCVARVTAHCQQSSRPIPHKLMRHYA